MSKYKSGVSVDYSYAGVASNPRPHRRQHFYVPSALRIPSLLLVFAVTLTFIGIVEYGIRVLPNAQKSPHPDPTGIVKSLIAKRQTSTSPTTGGGGTSTTIPGAFVPTVTTSPVPKSTTTPSPTVVATTNPSAFVPTTETAVPSVQASTNTGAFVPTSTTPTSGDGVSATTSSVSSVSTTITVPTSQSVVTSMPSSVVTTNSAGIATTFVTWVPTTSISTGLVSIPTKSPNNSTANVVKKTFPMYIIFVGSYLPVILAVVFKQFWTAIYSNAKLIEPFTQLARPEGALASSLYTFYLSSSLTPDPIMAFFKGHWFILWTSLVYAAVGFLAPLASEMIFVDTKYNCENPDINNPENPCRPRLSVDIVVARATQGLLTYIAISTLTILVMVFRMSTGLYSDPSSIASIASLVHHPEVVNDFRQFDNEASMKDIVQSLGNKRYKLDEYQRYDGIWRYGFVPAMPTDFHIRDPLSLHESTPSRRWKWIDMVMDCLFALVLLALLAVVGAYFKDGSDSGFNRFFNSKSFGARFVLTGAGTCIALNWKRLERNAHTISPYHRMGRQPSDPHSTILQRKSSIPFTSIFPMLLKGYWFAAFVATIAVLAEVLVIMLGAVPFASGQTLTESLVSIYTVMTVLALMVIATITLIVWRSRAPDLPRPPDTVAAVISYVSDSRMLEDFDGYEYITDLEMSSKLSIVGKRYVYGKRPGSDGQMRYLVDEETSLAYNWHA